MAEIKCPHCGGGIRLYDTVELAEVLDLQPVSVRRRARLNELGFKIGKEWAFTAADARELEKLPGPGRPPRKDKDDDSERETKDPLPG